jgi:hypothetical protein
MIIYGAGLAGLLAGALNQTASIIEAGPAEQVNHKAVLRFRSAAVGEAVGIPFKKVTVHKEIYMDGCSYAQANIQMANMYAQKVVGALQERSIWRLGATERWVAPEDLHAQLAERCHGRIRWNQRVAVVDPKPKEPIISTLPMEVIVKMLGIEEAPIFSSAPIGVARWRIPGANVYQTVYFPSPNTNWYRASITGDLLIAESVGVTDLPSFPFQAFGLKSKDCTPIDTSYQRYGKILPIDMEWRKRFMFMLSNRYKIFSLGRFATWRNILLDDVLNDIYVIRRLMTLAMGAYDLMHHQAVTEV